MAVIVELKLRNAEPQFSPISYFFGAPAGSFCLLLLLL